MKKRPSVKSTTVPSESSLSLSKKTQLGASGAVVGAIIGGPIGAVVGGIVGGVFGAAADASPDPRNGKHSEKSITTLPDTPLRATTKKRTSNPHPRARRLKSSHSRTRRRRR